MRYGASTFVTSAIATAAACQNRRLMTPPGLLPPRDADAHARVLLLHNRYRAAGGEERVVDELEALLRARGHAVARLERDSERTGRARAAYGLLHGGLDADDV